jgi:hypothetical protein
MRLRTRTGMIVAGLIAVASPIAPVLSHGGQDRESQQMTPDEIKAGIENRHPAAYYILAQKLFAAGARDEAVFWFYAGQLRYRFHLMANPTLPRSGDPALFASLSDVVGRSINEYAYGDVTAATKTMDDALAWDEKANNGFTSKNAHAARWAEVRKGLADLRDYTRTNAEMIRAQRKKNGLENRVP